MVLVLLHMLLQPVQQMLILSLWKIFFTHVRCHQVFMDISYDPCTSGQVLEVILGDESAPSVCDPFPEMASEACILDPTSLTLSGCKLMFILRSQNSER
ncbi:hypothetical protein R5R35_008999 [Gryllus longicercus]|uniref:Uncharacterized protein n=1 Tax=Gryllus longicercus TaxID=2509291 RepID=A0AAN9YZS4_9ORTH